MEVDNHEEKSDAHDNPLSPFSQPPAPPPQQPLPEKPAVAPRFIPNSVSDGFSGRDSGKTSPSPSPSKADGSASQILTLVQALKTAERQIDSQGKQVERLENLLIKERKARESAEERAKCLLEGREIPRTIDESGTLDENGFEPPSDTLEPQNREQITNGYSHHLDDDNLSTASTSTMNSAPEALKYVPPEEDASVSRLRNTLDVMTHEMSQMKVTMESYRQRAEGAEAEKKSLAQMVESIRAQQPNTSSARDFPKSSAAEPGNPLTTSRSPPTPPADRNSQHSDGDVVDRRFSAGAGAMGPLPEFRAELERTVSTVLQQQQRHGGGLAVQSAPYASMVGVVLIGVGIMTWINGWQRGD